MTRTIDERAFDCSHGVPLVRYCPHCDLFPPDTEPEPQPELPRYAGLAFAVALIAALFLLALVVKGVPR